MSAGELFHPQTDDELLACLPVMQALRPHLRDGVAFLVQVAARPTRGTGCWRCAAAARSWPAPAIA